MINYSPPRLAFAHLGGHDRNRNIGLRSLIQNSIRSVILGDPGGGKSNLALKLAYDIANDNVSHIAARVPFLVVLRDYAQSARRARRTSIVQYLGILCRTPYEVAPPEHAIEYFSSTTVLW